MEVIRNPKETGLEHITASLLHEDEFLGLHMLPCLHPIQIHTARQSSTVELHSMIARFLLTRNEYRDPRNPYEQITDLSRSTDRIRSMKHETGAFHLT